MGLYLCVFADDEDIAGVEVGSYADFDFFRSYVVNELEGGKAGTRFPTLILHSDCDGEWNVLECKKLADELDAVAEDARQRPAVAFPSEWQRTVARSIGLAPRNALESFIDVDGELLVERMRGLVDVALERQLPILFQ
ncbi:MULTISPECIES: Imm70 family immunity protein [unclassified Bradyrhizobium]